MVAGEASDLELTERCAIRVTAGALLPNGAQAVVSQEFAREKHGWVEVFADAALGRNILIKGCDVKTGTKMINKGCRFRPSEVSLTAAGGHDYT